MLFIININIIIVTIQVPINSFYILTNWEHNIKMISPCLSPQITSLTHCTYYYPRAALRVLRKGVI